MTATQVFGSYASAFRNQDLSPNVLHHAKRAVLDWYAALLAGQAVPPVSQLQALLLSESGQGSARLADGRRTTARTAAFINGAAAHAAEVDDSFRDAMYHPGAATIAAALAVAQDTGTSGMEFLRGVVLGYEVSTRIGVVLGRAHYRYWQNTGSVGVFGAAAASAGLMDLQGEQFANALATAATFSSGLQQAFRMDSMSKPLHPGRAAEGGVLAAQLAAQGVTGSMDILDGDAGMGRAMSDGPDWTRVGATLGQDFHITRLTFKNHIGCGHTFAAIDAALHLVQQHDLPPHSIKHVRVATYATALDIACYDDPRTSNEARFSVPFMVATALIHRSVRLAAYTPERLGNPDIRALMKRITVEVDPELDAIFPRRRSARVDIETNDGQRYTRDQPDRKGDPELPLSDAELEEKYLELATPVIGASKAERLLRAIWALDEVENMEALVP